MQDIQTLDARGCLCPQPLIKTRRLWKTLNAGDRFRVLLDNDIAHLNLVAFLNDQNADPGVTREGEDWVVSATRSGDIGQSAVKVPQQPVVDKTAPASEPVPANYAVVLKSDRMGQGDDDLGAILVKGYLNTLKELDQKPATIILYNGGVKLAARDSGAETSLKALEKESVDVIVCGACVDFFALNDQLAAGRVSNMYEIAEKIAAAGHVVYP